MDKHCIDVYDSAVNEDNINDAIFDVADVVDRHPEFAIAM